MADLIQASPQDLSDAAPVFQSKSTSSAESLEALQPLTEQVVGDMAGLSEMGGLAGTLETFHYRFQISGECLAVALSDFGRSLVTTAQSFTGNDQQMELLFKQLQEQMPVAPFFPGFGTSSGLGTSTGTGTGPEEPGDPDMPDDPFGPGLPEVPFPDELPIPILVP